MSQVDQKRAFNKLKHDLEPWRDLMAQLDSLLSWEKNYYPAIIFAVVTLCFLLLWAIELSVMTMISLAGLFAVIFDYVYPSLSRLLFSPDEWGGKQEAQFEHICTYLSNIKMSLIGWYEHLFTTKERKSTMFVIIVSTTLLGLAWIGAIINNLLLMYLVVLGVAMYPGIREKCVFNDMKEKLGSVINSKIEKFRENSKKEE